MEDPIPDGRSGEDGAPEPDKRRPGLGDFFWIGMACAISIVGAGAIGYGLDSWLKTSPWFTLAGLVFGIFCAVALAANQFRRFM